MKQIQGFHQQGKGWRDIAYSFLVASDGQVFEGIGLNQHLNTDPQGSLTICWLGNYETQQPTEQIMHATAWLVLHASLSSWTTGYPRITGGHSDQGRTACPGRHAYSQIGSMNRRVTSMLDSMKTSDTSFPPALTAGATGGSVKALQSILINKHNQDLGLSGADGVYGERTVKAVLNVQRYFGQIGNGVVDADTWRLLFL